MTLARYQTRTVFCAICGSHAEYNDDLEKIVADWNEFGVDDPCDDGEHVPEEFMDDDPELKEIDRIINKINETGSFLRAIEDKLT